MNKIIYFRSPDLPSYGQDLGMRRREKKIDNVLKNGLQQGGKTIQREVSKIWDFIDNVKIESLKGVILIELDRKDKTFNVVAQKNWV